MQAMASNLDTTVAAYDDQDAADRDWFALEDAAQAGLIEIVDAALVENRDGNAEIRKRESKHGWGKGAVAGAVVGILFPPSIVGAALVGAGGGELFSAMTRALGRGSVKDLGETLDSGALGIVVLSSPAHTNTICHTLAGAKATTTVGGATIEEVRQLMAGG
jgi:uncharacterized membrane protein